MPAKHTGNPFGLTDRQQEVMDALAQDGNCKLVARRLGLSSDTVDNYTREAAERMGAPNRMLAVLTWDRMRRAA